MKKPLLRWIAAALFGTAAFAPDRLAAADLPACCRTGLTNTAPLPDRSLYQVTSSWTNDAAAPCLLASLRGRPQVVTLFFAHCEFACPLLVQDMKRIEAGLPEAARTNVGLVLVSFDSERDTPEALARYRRQHALNANWTLLTGAPDDVLELAALLGVKFKKDARGQFAHSNLITLLDADGQIAAQQPGLNQSGRELIDAVNALAARPAHGSHLP